MQNTALEQIVQLLRENFPEKTIVDISELENEDHQTYKYLYGIVAQEKSELTEENFNMGFQLKDREREIYELKEKLHLERSANEKLSATSEGLMEFIERFSNQEIIVSNIKVFGKDGVEIQTDETFKTSLKDTISLRPGVYDGVRPSWFTPLKNEFNKENVAKKAASNTGHIIHEQLAFWKKLKSRLIKKEVSVSDAMTEYDIQRKLNIIKLLESQGNNYEKYLKYFLLTPGLSKDYMSTLVGAAELGLDANAIIELLEQPAENFNKEIIEIYVSETHKGTEFNLKKEFAEELLRGDWYVVSDINGVPQRFQLAPLKLLEEINERLENISGILSDLADEKLCANLAQSFSDVHNDEKNSDEYIPENASTFIEFNDSDLM